MLPRRLRRGTGEGVSPRYYWDRFFENPMAEFARHFDRLQVSTPVEVFERDNEVFVRAELAGVEPADVDLRITDEGLTLRGERRTETEEERDGVHFSERVYGTFARTIAFPVSVNSAAAKATFRNGLLEVRVPRRQLQEGEDGRRLDIKVE